MVEARRLVADRHGDVLVMTMKHADNRLHPTMLAELHAVLDSLEAQPLPSAGVLGTGKFFCNGLDLDYMEAATPDQIASVLSEVQRLLGRVLVFPRPIVAAVNGHAFGAGALLAMACDERVMRTERGYICLPEVDLGQTFSTALISLLRAKLTPPAVHHTVLSGMRYGSSEAAAAGLVDGTASEDDLLSTVCLRATDLASKPTSFGDVKRDLYLDVAISLGHLTSDAEDIAHRHNLP